MNWLKRKASREASLGAATTSPSEFAKAAEAAVASSPGRRWQSRCVVVPPHLFVPTVGFRLLQVVVWSRSGITTRHMSADHPPRPPVPPGSEVPPLAGLGEIRSKSWQYRRVQPRRSMSHASSGQSAMSACSSDDVQPFHDDQCLDQRCIGGLSRPRRSAHAAIGHRSTHWFQIHAQTHFSVKLAVLH